MKIETHNLIKRYGEKTVVNDVNVEVEQGTIVGLLGPNGAGKTTTFYMIVGIIHLWAFRFTSATSSASATCRRNSLFSRR